MVYAVIETGGKQYRVKEKDELYVEKLNAKDGEKVVLRSIAIFRDGKIFLDGSGVEASILKSGKGKKMIVFTYKAKKNCKRKMGHRQPYTKIRIDSISG